MTLSEQDDQGVPEEGERPAKELALQGGERSLLSPNRYEKSHGALSP
jgi:hypothetical protein